MATFTKAALLLCALALTGCSEPRSRDFFAKDGVTVGAPTALGSGSYKIPLEFVTAIVHSGQWIDSVDADVANADILITARFSSSGRKSRYPGYVTVTGTTPGTYALKYRDPNGSMHAIGPVVLP
ncbi:MAG: hypothetical protein ACK5CW_17865 [Verrucomicrobiota bacterium]|jgi:hypothetical protein